MLHEKAEPNPDWGFARSSVCAFPTFTRFSRRSFAMMGAFRWNCLGCWAVFTAAALVLPANARAGCTHPWVQTTGAAGSLTDLALLNSIDQSDRSQTGFPAPAKRSGPCAGGTCSQAPGFPPASTIPGTTRVELWGELRFESPPLVPLAGAPCLEPGCEHPRRSVSQIERPPRWLGIG
jgi:hypothetical protein